MWVGSYENIDTVPNNKRRFTHSEIGPRHILLNSVSLQKQLGTVLRETTPSCMAAS